MSREADLEALVAQNTAAVVALGDEVGELKTTGNDAVARLREIISTQVAAVDALTAEVAAAREGAVSAEKMAELQAATDANVAAAAEAKADADQVEAEWAAVAAPEAPPAEPPVA